MCEVRERTVVYTWGNICQARRLVGQDMTVDGVCDLRDTKHTLHDLGIFTVMFLNRLA